MLLKQELVVAYSTTAQTTKSTMPKCYEFYLVEKAENSILVTAMGVKQRARQEGKKKLQERRAARTRKRKFNGRGAQQSAEPMQRAEEQFSLTDLAVFIHDLLQIQSAQLRNDIVEKIKETIGIENFREKLFRIKHQDADSIIIEYRIKTLSGSPQKHYDIIINKDGSFEIKEIVPSDT